MYGRKKDRLSIFVSDTFSIYTFFLHPELVFRVYLIIKSEGKQLIEFLKSFASVEISTPNILIFCDFWKVLGSQMILGFGTNL